MSKIIVSNMESYTELQDGNSTLFEDRAKYNAIMSALARVIYRDMRNTPTAV